MHCVQILAPTLLEYWAVRRTLSGADVRWAGMRLVRWKGAGRSSIVVVCGLAGALVPGLHPGTVLVPESVGRPDGKMVHCDAEFVRALVTVAHTLGFQPDTGPLLTAPSLVVGAARQEWAERGFVAVDMETGLLADSNLRLATIRVVLDSPEQGISQDWLRPAAALLWPRRWVRPKR
jgi:nucleoside phosphorylase